jgi:GTP-binding protein EngB required for normal cell division
LGSKQTDGTETINLWNGNDVGFIDTPGFGDKGENSPIILMNRIRQFLRDSSVTVRGILIVDEFTSEIGLEMDFIVQVLREFFIFDAK